MMRSGNYLTKPELPFTLGYEAAGTIEAVGADVTNFSVGQRVLATASSGGYAEYATARAALTMPIPDELGDGEATALLVQGLTALGLLNETRSGQTILIHAAAGGVGSLLVQLAKFKGLKVIGTASSEQKLQLVASLGADFAINYSEADWTDEVLQATGGKGADWIIEMVGGATFEQSLRALAAFGRLVHFGQAGREGAPKLEPGALMARSQGVIGFWLVHMMQRPDLMTAAMDDMFAAVKAGELEAIEGGTYPLEEARQAHEDIRGRKTTGKLILTT